SGALSSWVHANGIYFSGSRTDWDFSPMKAHRDRLSILSNEESRWIKPVFCFAGVSIRLGKLALFRVVSKCGGIELKPCVIIGARLKGADRVALRNRSVAKGLIGKVYRHAIQ